MKEVYLTSPTDLDFSNLEGKELESIKTDGNNSGLTDASLFSVSKIVGLQELDLEWASNITDLGLEQLGKLHTLKYIDLSFCEKITEKGIAKLQSTVLGITIER